MKKLLVVLLVLVGLLAFGAVAGAEWDGSSVEANEAITHDGGPLLIPEGETAVINGVLNVLSPLEVRGRLVVEGTGQILISDTQKFNDGEIGAEAENRPEVILREGSELEQRGGIVQVKPGGFLTIEDGAQYRTSIDDNTLICQLDVEGSLIMTGGSLRHEGQFTWRSGAFALFEGGEVRLETVESGGSPTILVGASADIRADFDKAKYELLYDAGSISVESNDAVMYNDRYFAQEGRKVTLESSDSTMLSWTATPYPEDGDNPIDSDNRYDKPITFQMPGNALEVSTLSGWGGEDIGSGEESKLVNNTLTLTDSARVDGRLEATNSTITIASGAQLLITGEIRLEDSNIELEDGGALLIAWGADTRGLGSSAYYEVISKTGTPSARDMNRATADYDGGTHYFVRADKQVNITAEADDFGYWTAETDGSDPLDDSNRYNADLQFTMPEAPLRLSYEPAWSGGDIAEGETEELRGMSRTIDHDIHIAGKLKVRNGEVILAPGVTVLVTGRLDFSDSTITIPEDSALLIHHGATVRGLGTREASFELELDIGEASAEDGVLRSAEVDGESLLFARQGRQITVRVDESENFLRWVAKTDGDNPIDSDNEYDKDITFTMPDAKLRLEYVESWDGKNIDKDDTGRMRGNTISIDRDVRIAGRLKATDSTIRLAANSYLYVTGEIDLDNTTIEYGSGSGILIGWGGKISGKADRVYYEFIPKYGEVTSDSLITKRFDGEYHYFVQAREKIRMEAEDDFGYWISDTRGNDPLNDDNRYEREITFRMPSRPLKIDAKAGWDGKSIDKGKQEVLNGDDITLRRDVSIRGTLVLVGGSITIDEDVQLTIRSGGLIQGTGGGFRIDGTLRIDKGGALDRENSGKGSDIYVRPTGALGNIGGKLRAANGKLRVDRGEILLAGESRIETPLSRDGVWLIASGASIRGDIPEDAYYELTWGSNMRNPIMEVKESRTYNDVKHSFVQAGSNITLRADKDFIFGRWAFSPDTENYAQRVVQMRQTDIEMPEYTMKVTVKKPEKDEYIRVIPLTKDKMAADENTVKKDSREAYDTLEASEALLVLEAPVSELEPNADIRLTAAALQYIRQEGITTIALRAGGRERIVHASALSVPEGYDLLVELRRFQTIWSAEGIASYNVSLRVVLPE